MGWGNGETNILEMKDEMIKRALPVLSFLLLHTVVVFAQDLPLDTLVKNFNRYRETALQEKIYGHLDRNFFLTGETLWFKAYTVDGTLHKPLDVSKVAYAEILDKANFPVLQAKIQLQDGLGSGSFFLPASLSSGPYKLRLYTNWMKNFSPEFYFDEAFTLVNPFITPEHLPVKPNPAYTVDFFPEGGNLVAGVTSKVAFRVLDDRGRGADTKGWILDAKGDTVTTFTPQKFGIGHFYFTPGEGKAYNARLNAQGDKTFALPQVHSAGMVMEVRDSADVIRVVVTAAGVEPGAVHLFVHARQSVAFAATRKLDGHTVFELPKKDLPAGISHLTLFNTQLKPVCERLFFTFPEKELGIALSTNQRTFGPRRKVTVSLGTSENDKPVPAKLSMSVYRVDSLSGQDRMHIFPYLWISSDLTGEVESPGYYVSARSHEVASAMDNLMLTHGWRRFNWDEVMSDNTSFAFLPEVSEHIVTATILKDGQPQPAVFTYLGSPGKIIRAYGSWSDRNGEVRFEIKDFYGPRRILVQTRTDTTETYAIRIQNPFSISMDADKPGPFHLDTAVRSDLLARSISMQVQDIFYYDTQGYTFEAPDVDSSAFYGTADNTYYLDDYTRFPVMEEVMREYVPGVFVRKRKDGFHFIVADQANGGVLHGDPMVLLDGVPIIDVDDIMGLDPLKVKKLEVVKRTYYLGQAAFYGIVSYTTYQGDLGGMEFDARSLSLNYDGLQLNRKFFKPQYTRDQNNDRMPDQRHLLHWEPEITTDKSGTATLEFFTSDVPGQYRIVVEGLNANGYSGSQTSAFTVTAQENQ